MLTNPFTRPNFLKLGACIIVCLFIVSCKKTIDTDSSTNGNNKSLLEITPAEYASIAYDNPRELSIDEIKKIIKDYPLKSNLGIKSTDDFKYDINEKYYLNNDGTLEQISSSPKSKGAAEDKRIPVYNVKLSGNGKNGSALVCADERTPIVLAYMPMYDLKPEMLSKNLMYQSSKKYIVNRIAYLGHLKDSLRAETLKKIIGKIGKLPETDFLSFIKGKIKITTTSPKTKSPVESYLPSQVISQVGPLATTEWDQEGVSNQLIKAANGCTHAPAGCLVIAGAQVLAQLEPPLSVFIGMRNVPGTIDFLPYGEPVSWPLLKQSSFIGFNDDPNKQIMFSRLIRDVFNNTGTIAACEGSGTQMQRMIDYLRTYINIDNSASFNVQQIKASLDNSHSVIGAGSRISGTEKIRHAWVIDGYAICQKNSGSTPGDLVHQYDLYLHANLGWGGSDTGWFLVGTDWNLSFDVDWGQRQYGVDMQMAANARRK